MWTRLLCISFMLCTFPSWMWAVLAGDGCMDSWASMTGYQDEPLMQGNASSAVQEDATEQSHPQSSVTGAPPPSWPKPVNDSRPHAFLLFDNLENEAGNSPNALRYAFQGWYGGDYNRLWINSEGRQNLAKSQGGVELQTLYGRLISPFFDFQAGLRVDNLHGGNLNASRVFGVIGFQGLSPYRFDIQPLLFVDQRGNVSARFEGTYELLCTQRLVFQPRIEMNVAVQDVPRFEIGSGLSDIEVGGRLRYEIRREFAPYVGISYSQSYGGTAAYARRAGENVQSLSFVAGIRFWWQSFRHLD